MGNKPEPCLFGLSTLTVAFIIITNIVPVDASDDPHSESVGIENPYEVSDESTKKITAENEVTSPNGDGHLCERAEEVEC